MHFFDPILGQRSRWGENEIVGSFSVVSLKQIFDRDLLRRRRERQAHAIGAHDFLLSRVGDDFLERFAAINRQFEVGINLGAYNGLLSRRLRASDRIGELIDLEMSSGLLEQCGGLRVQADEEFLPIRRQSVDLVVSGLQFQFVNDLPGILVQVRRALKPDGLMLASLLGGETLVELREAWLAAESEITGGASPRVSPFADIRELGGLLQRAGFSLPVVDSDVVRVNYDNPVALMRDLKAMAASNCLMGRSRRPVSRWLLEQVCEIYQDRFGNDQSRVSATFEIITLTAWAAHEGQQRPLAPGSAEVRLADALGSRK